MKLVITEKAIAGRRIAAILAGKQVPLEKTGTAQLLAFEKDGEPYVIVPLRGHITDVDFPKTFAPWLGTDLKQLIKAPIEVESTARGIAALLKKTAKEADEVIIATDADREGEAIGLEAINYIRTGNPKVTIKRAYFSAITPKDINDAFSKLGEVDYPFAESANARREIDLIWGATLTRFLSLISGRLGKEFLSAGRVQTPTLALIVKREKERLAFEKKKYWVVEALFDKKGNEFLAEHKEGRFWEKEEAEKVMAKKAEQGKVEKVTKSQKVLKRPVPFSTTMFLRAASSIGFSAGDAMNVAESLYMKGFISYPRTDNSTYPPTLDLKGILNNLLPNPAFTKDVEKILEKGKLEPSRGKETKDHPPIHPVSNASQQELDPKHWKIYELVCRRFFATLSEDAETENLSVEINLNEEPFIAKGQVIIKAGWKAVYPYSTLKEVILPELNEGDLVDLKNLEMLEKETQPPARYSQGALIKLMEDKGLGTKSTRHETIQKLYSRQYISNIKSLEPSKVAFAVIDSLEKHKAKVEEPELTADIEKEMDKVAAGQKSKEEVVDGSREMLTGIMEELLKHKNEIGSQIRSASREDAVMMPCPTCEDGNLRQLRGRTGKRFVGCTNYPKCTQTYALPQQGLIIPLDKICEQCKAPMIKVARKGRAFEMCLDMKCPSKADWGKKKAKKPAAKKATKTTSKK